MDKLQTGTQQASLVIGIVSAPNNVENRKAIRETWASSLPSGVVLKFFLGRNSQVTQESAQFGDMVVLDVEDKYTLLPGKVLAAMKWAYSNYDLSFFLKMDDDIYLRADKLVKILESKYSQQSGVYLGTKWETGIPIRDKSSKWYLPIEVYQPRELVPFNEGNAYLLSVDCVSFLVNNMDVLKPVGTLEDLSVAFWLHALQVHPQLEPSFVSANRGHKCVATLTMMPDITVQQMYSMHKAIVAGDAKQICAGIAARPNYG